MLYAILAMFFAGITSIFAKFGLENINADLGLVIRTSVIFVLVLATGIFGNARTDISILTTKQVLLLVGSGVTAYLSWLYYFRALKAGPVTYVASIDKASIIVTLILSFVLLKEPMKPQVLMGGGLIFLGMLVLIWK